MKQKWMAAIRVLVSVGIISFFVFFQRETLATFVATLKKTNLQWFVLALIGYIPVMFLGILRWRALLKVQEVHLPFLTLVRLFFIGSFFNHFTLGATGGDVVKAYYVAHEAKPQRAGAVMTVFLDRMIGMMALFALALIALFFTHKDPHLGTVNRIVWSLFLGTLLLGGILFNKSLLKKIPGGEALMQRLPFYPALRKVYNAFHLYNHHKGVLLLTFTYSIVLQTIMICVIAILGKALQIEDTHIKHYFLLFPIIATLAALPISVGGLGVGEAAFVYFFGLVGVPSGQAFALGLSTRFVWIFWGLVGGFIYMLPASKVIKKDAQEALKVGESYD